MSLQEIITHIRGGKGNPHEDWPLIECAPENLGLETDCTLSPIEIDESAEDLDEIILDVFKNRGLRSTIDYQTVKDSIEWADRLAGRGDDQAAAEVIRYYIRFDAWPEGLGAPDPPSNDVLTYRLDRKFYESLGPEQESTSCKLDNCARGTVRFSVFCAYHHFESIKKKPCPF